MSRNYSTEEVSARDECEFNILVLGLLAAQFGSNSGRSPVRGWGKASAFRSVTVGDQSYSMSPARKRGIPGLRMTIRNVNTKALISDDWLPWSVLEQPIRCFLPREPYLDPVLEAVYS